MLFAYHPMQIFANKNLLNISRGDTAARKIFFLQSNWQNRSFVKFEILKSFSQCTCSIFRYVSTGCKFQALVVPYVLFQQMEARLPRPSTFRGAETETILKKRNSYMNS